MKLLERNKLLSYTPERQFLEMDRNFYRGFSGGYIIPNPRPGNPGTRLQRVDSDAQGKILGIHRRHLCGGIYSIRPVCDDSLEQAGRVVSNGELGDSENRPYC